MPLGNHDFELLVDILGGRGAIARELDIVPHALSMWRSRGLPQSAATRQKLQRIADKKLLTAESREKIRAMLWDF
jgi:hypothetical protein|tara:strand:+ start:3691 stop:3915 length:225 start_codon:yes stop_codon:yes gene_type:complete